MELQAQTSAAVVVTYPEGFLRQFSYVRASVLVRSPLKHTCALPLFSVLMQMVKWFLEQGWPQKGLGLQTQRELMSHAAGETQDSEFLS